MNRAVRFLLVAGALMMAISTMMGAYGVHSLQGPLGPERFESFRTAVHYQFFHSLGVLAIGLIADRLPSRTIRLGGWLIVLGVVLFSVGVISGLAAEPSPLSRVAPLGGMCLIIGWMTAVYAIIRTHATAADLPPNSR